MWPYWVMFLPAAFVALYSEDDKKSPVKRRPSLERTWFAWGFVWLSLTLLIGYRFQVGADFGNYFAYLYGAYGKDFTDVLQESDPSFRLLNWVSVQMDWGIFGVNVLGGAIFATGLLVFCRHQPRPWLALAVSIPYVVIVVAMGYNRQGIALGLVMGGLVALEKRSVFWFFVWVALAATFHKSALLILPLGALALTRNKLVIASLVALTCAVAYLLIVAAQFDAMLGGYAVYISAQASSEGALVRLLMNAIAAGVWLLWRQKLQVRRFETNLWTIFSIASFALLGLLVVSPSSTAIDRMAVYLLPLQIAVFARLPQLFTHRDSAILTGSILAYYGLVQFVWLNYAVNAFSWIPYRFYPLEAWI